jgi:multiple sugar transport system ATP-binding protein
VTAGMKPLKVQMRAEVQRIQRRINVATIYVTHDQVEAMTMGDRVAIMRSGVLQQVDTPQHLYNHPDNPFVAAFIGSPAMNLYEPSLTEDAGTVRLGSQNLELPQPVRAAHPALAAYADQKIILGLRPDMVPPGCPKTSRVSRARSRRRRRDRDRPG